MMARRRAVERQQFGRRYVLMEDPTGTRHWVSRSVRNAITKMTAVQFFKQQGARIVRRGA